ncbi:hypothetical protein PR003_g29378, partial [Phytophthora rubi]
MVLLNCAVVGEKGVISIIIEDWKTVALLKKAIKDEKPNTIKCDADGLQLFLAKKDGAWLESDSEDVKKLKKGEKTGAVEALTSEEKELQGESGLQTVLTGMPKPSTDQVHVLVVVPSGEDIDVGQDVEGESKYTRELRLYQQRGNLIKVQHADYCGQILDKIDQLYEDESRTLPFICVEGSSGMGKTQLAFALGGRRPWFYWPATRIGSDSQNLYQNFDKISDAFDE